MTSDLPEHVRALAVRFGIEDTPALDDALSEAFHAADVARFEQMGLSRNSDAEVDQHGRLTRLVSALRHELTSPDHASPFTLGADAELLRRELGHYADWLSANPAYPQNKRRGAPTHEPSKAFVVELAQRWPSLTGEEPTAWRDNITGENGGRFYEFLMALWPDRWPCAQWPDNLILPIGEFPSAPTVHRWIASSS